jgi:serine/threonine protein kinase
MDCCDIGSVKDMMKNALTTLEEDQIGYICLQALKGLAYLHAMNIIHLDVKAANVIYFYL